MNRKLTPVTNTEETRIREVAEALVGRAAGLALSTHGNHVEWATSKPPASCEGVMASHISEDRWMEVIVRIHEYERKNDER